LAESASLKKLLPVSIPRNRIHDSALPQFFLSAGWT
jgi:hypothetical protein